GLGREERHKIVISMALGLLLAGVGMDTVSAQLRMTFGSTELMRGINFLVAVIGLFGISEILLTMEERLALQGHPAHMSLRVVWRGWGWAARRLGGRPRSGRVRRRVGRPPGGAPPAAGLGHHLSPAPSPDKGRLRH